VTEIRAPWWLRLTVPIAMLALACSVAGIVADRVYADATDDWETQAIGQDVANLVVFPAMLVLAFLAARGSRAALLAWLGTVVYAAYCYAIYAFDVRFGPLFLAYVAILGMSAWALVGGLVAVAPESSAAIRRTRVHRVAAGVLIATAVVFGSLWLAEDVPAILSGEAPESLDRAGLTTNPVHVLDLAFFLPVSMLAGTLLGRGRAWGAVLAPVVLVAMAAIGAGIVALSLVAVARDQDGSLAVAGVVRVLGLLQAWLGWRLLRPPGEAPR
jgi:hypothetical protein